MKIFRKIPFLAFMLLASCASAPSGRLQAGGEISLTFEGDRMLNVRGGEPHTLALSVYQLRDPGAFKELSQTADGLYRLLQCAPFDGSVSDAKRIVVYPGRDRKVSLARVEGAVCIGIVAGYYAMDRYRTVRLFSLPAQESGPFTFDQEPVPLDVTIRLGPRGILPSRQAVQAAAGAGIAGTGPGAP